MALKAAVTAAVAAHRDTIEAVVDGLHGNPETGLGEFAASTLLCDLLERGGYGVERGLAGLPTAFRARRGTGGPTIALLAEMDALPELGHACGHNVIAAAAAGAALVLGDCLAPERARIAVVGTPAEELGLGKVQLLAAGVFDDVEFAMMVHPSSRRRVAMASLAVSRVRYLFRGRSAHAGAYPEEGINALDAVIQTFNAVNALRQQLPPTVRVHGIVTEGGVVPNIIPERGGCYFYVRAADPVSLAQARERVDACARGAALAAGCSLEVTEEGHPLAPFRSVSSFDAVYADQLRSLGLAVDDAPAVARGSSDIGNLSRAVPTIHPHVPLGAGLRIHTPEFARAAGAEAGRAAACEGAAALALTALALAGDERLRAVIRDEFNKNS